MSGQVVANFELPDEQWTQDEGSMGICTPELSAVREGRRESFFIEESDIHKGE